MKGRISLGAVILLSTFCFSLVLAAPLHDEHFDDGEEMQKMQRHEMMMKKEKMMDRCGFMNMPLNIVATSDGGVVVVLGNKLSKYDSNLNFVKEVELKMPKEGESKVPMDKMMMPRDKRQENNR